LLEKSSLGPGRSDLQVVVALTIVRAPE